VASTGFQNTPPPRCAPRKSGFNKNAGGRTRPTTFTFDALRLGKSGRLHAVLGRNQIFIASGYEAAE